MVRHTWFAALCVSVATVGCTSPPAATDAWDHAIWNGTPTEDFPAVGALTVEGAAFCTGTLIAPTTVLTAAHCVDYMDGVAGADLRFFTGQGEAGLLDGGAVVDNAESHAACDGWVGDIGLVYLAEPVDEVPQFVNVDEMLPGTWQGRNVTLVGYGITGDGLDDSGLKLMTEVQVYAFDEDVFFHYTAGTNACFGDSGGPALYEVDGRWTVVGVLSGIFGHMHDDSVCIGGGGYQIRPDVYADWIEENAAINDDTAGDDDDTADDDDDDTADDDDDDDAVEGEPLEDSEGGCQCRKVDPARSPLAALLVLATMIAAHRRRH